MKSLDINRMLLNFYRKYRVHILVWLLYITYEILSIAFALNHFGNPLVYLIFYAVLIFFFYLHAEVTLPFAVKRRAWIWLTLPIALVVQTGCFIGIQYLVAVFLVKVQLAETSPVLNSSYLWRNAYRAMFFTGFSTGYYFLTNYIATNKKAAELEKDFLKSVIVQNKIENELFQAQNAFLKAQINSHLLFNTLDFIYHKVNEHSDQAGEAVVKLAEMMRFAIDSDQAGTHVTLIEEIDQVNNLIYLHHLRDNNPSTIDFHYSAEAANLKLIPLILLTLAENMFKHGDLKHPQYRPQIAVFIDRAMLRLYTSNAISSRKPLIGANSGLSNTCNRLLFAYGETIEFKHQVNENNEFIVSVAVPVKLLS